MPKSTHLSLPGRVTLSAKVLPAVKNAVDAEAERTGMPRDALVMVLLIAGLEAWRASRANALTASTRE